MMRPNGEKMIVTEEMVRGTHPKSPCRICVGQDCAFDVDEMSSLDCIYLRSFLNVIERRMENSEARLWRKHTKN